MRTDDAIADLWDICADGWFFDAACDQWWAVRASCPHGEWRASSRGALDLWTGFEEIVEAAHSAHLLISEAEGQA